MTISDLKRAMERRFDRSERATGRRFDRLQRTKADKAELGKAVAGLRREIAKTRRYVDRLGSSLREEIAASAEETRGYVDRLGSSLREEIAASAAETRRHFEVVIENYSARFMSSYGDGIAANIQKLANHEARIARLERRSI